MSQKCQLWTNVFSFRMSGTFSKFNINSTQWRAINYISMETNSKQILKCFYQNNILSLLSSCYIMFSPKFISCSLGGGTGRGAGGRREQLACNQFLYLLLGTLMWVKGGGLTWSNLLINKLVANLPRNKQMAFASKIGLLHKTLLAGGP